MGRRLKCGSKTKNKDVDVARTDNCSCSWAVFIKDSRACWSCVSFLGYTNAPTGMPLPFVLLDWVTNHERVAIICRSVLSEIEGGRDDLAPGDDIRSQL